jgi:hypothetical protein
LRLTISSRTPIGVRFSIQRFIHIGFTGMFTAAVLLAPVAARAESELEPTVNRYWYTRAHKIADFYGLGDVFVRQMMQESGFADDVIYGQRVSWAGAQGIAQIMAEVHPTVNPLKPEEALRYAARHMLDLLVRYNGSLSRALAAYNAGAGNVDWAVQQGGERWQEFLPDETRHYLAVILEGQGFDTIAGWPELGRWWSARSDVIGTVLPMAAEPS